MLITCGLMWITCETTLGIGGLWLFMRKMERKAGEIYLFNWVIPALAPRVAG